MIALNNLVERLNRKPVLWAVCLGLITYLSAFLISVLSTLSSTTPVFEIGFLSAGSIVMGYHWAMSRYMQSNTLGQVIQISFGVALLTLVMAFIGATTHIKAYEVINEVLFSVVN